MVHEHLLAHSCFLAERGVIKFELFDTHLVVAHRAAALHFALNVVDEVFRAVWPAISTVAMLLAIFPLSFEFFAVRVVKYTIAIALIQLELAFVCLPLWPHVRPVAMFFTLVERAEEETTVGPLVEALALHDVVEEGTLVDFSA